MRILIDMDDTMELLLAAWLEVANKKFNTNVHCEDIKDFDLTKAFPGLSHDDVYDIILEDDFWQNVKPMPNASEVIKRLIDKGHEIYIVTATPYESVKGKMEHVLFKYFPYITWDHVIITKNKKMLKADVMIDDGIHNLEDGDYIKILVSAPYNLDYDAKANGMYRANNWLEIEKIIETL